MAGPRMILLHTCVITCVVLVSSFNLDTTIPVIKEGPADSYFGFSVAQHQQVRSSDGKIEGNFLLIGAPLLDIPESHERKTGGIYKCNALSPKQDDCELLLKSEYNQNSTRNAGRANQWLGVTVRSGGPGKMAVACAHRNKELVMKGNTIDNVYGLGLCYLFTQDLSFNPNLGLANPYPPCAGYPKERDHEEYGLCQAGTGAYITEEEQFITGSPGAINWRGMLSMIDVSASFGIKRLYRSPMIEQEKPPVPLVSYLGYSVLASKFDNTDETYFLASAPRSNLNGQIVFFRQGLVGNVLDYHEPQILTGDQAFSGYGQDMIAVDVNNDGYSDLVVGCPFYVSQDKDKIRVGGAVYIYIGNGTMITKFTQPQIIIGRSVTLEECEKLDCLHSRFGFSLANAGDLNKDDFQDFAVGAPFEGRGAVYIYHGSAAGVKEPYSQRIYAEDISAASGWTSFGYSLSGALDLDQNAYPDLLVGSYEDNKVALLRTRPIISLHSNVTVFPDKLNMSSEADKKCLLDGKRYYCIEVKICLRFTAEPVDRFDGRVEIIYTISAEPTREQNPRLEFRKNGVFNSVEDTVTLLEQSRTGLPDSTSPRYTCVTETAYLKEQITDVLSTLQLGISYRLPERTGPIQPATPDTLPDINEYPILDAGLTQTEQMLMASVEFVKKCGEDQICKSDLQLDVKPQNIIKNDRGAYVIHIGKVDMLEMKVEIENRGEIAYQTGFYMQKPDYLRWSRSEPNIGCDIINDTFVECKDIGSKEIGKPIKSGEVSEFVVSFQVDKEKISTVRSFELTVWVNTTSTEQTPSGDRITIPIFVFVNADLSLSPKVEPESIIVYSGEVRGESAMRNEKMIGPSINHTYTILNSGGGDVQSSEVKIYWPYELMSKYPHGKHLLYLMHDPEVESGDATCFHDGYDVNVVGIAERYALDRPPSTFTVTTENEGEGEYIVINDDTERRRRRRQAESEEREDPNAPIEIREEPNIGAARGNKRVIHLDCDNNRARCYEIRCVLGILRENQKVVIKIRSRLWESTLLEDYRDVDEVHIRSKAKIHIRPELNVVQPDEDNDIAYATTIAVPSIQIAAEKPLQWWIYALAALCGIILLILLALCLWKCGFFKRTRFDDMTTYNVTLQKKKDIQNPTYDTLVKTQTDYSTPDETDYFLKR